MVHFNYVLGVTTSILIKSSGGNLSDYYGGWIVSKVQSLFWRRVTSLRRGVVSTGGGAFQLEDTTFCGGGVRFDLEEGV